MLKDVNKWLKQAPSKKEIVEFEEITSSGKVVVKIIPEKTIETLLDQLTDQNWSTKNFQSSRWTDSTGKEWMDASLELVVNYYVVVLISPYDLENSRTESQKEMLINRTLVGAVSFPCNQYSQHLNNTAKSLCITNAASDLGRRMGKDLNESALPVVYGLNEGVRKNKIHETLKGIKNDILEK